MGRLIIYSALAILVIGCKHQSNRLEYGQLDSEKLDKEMEFAVLRAPKKPNVNPDELPVVVLLHGMGDNHHSLDRFGLSDRLYKAMIEGRIPDAHFIMPYGERGFYFNWYDGSHPYEDYILNEVIPAGEKLLGVAPNRENRHIMGVSMGATGSINIGLRHPDKFASITSLSGLILNAEQADEMRESILMRFFVDVEAVWGDGTDRVFNDSYNPYLLVEKRPDEYPQKIFLGCGSEEGRKIGETTEMFHEFLQKKKIEHRFEVYDGGHGWRWWAPLIDDALKYVLTKPAPAANP